MSEDQVIDVAAQEPAVTEPQQPSQEEIIKQIESYVNNELRFAQETITRALNTCVGNIANALVGKK